MSHHRIVICLTATAAALTLAACSGESTSQPTSPKEPTTPGNPSSSAATSKPPLVAHGTVSLRQFAATAAAHDGAVGPGTPASKVCSTLLPSSALNATGLAGAAEYLAPGDPAFAKQASRIYPPTNPKAFSYHLASYRPGTCTFFDVVRVGSPWQTAALVFAVSTSGHRNTPRGRAKPVLTVGSPKDRGVTMTLTILPVSQQGSSGPQMVDESGTTPIDSLPPSVRSKVAALMRGALVKRGSTS